jgi:hypothetical protein
MSDKPEIKMGKKEIEIPSWVRLDNTTNPAEKGFSILEDPTSTQSFVSDIGAKVEIAQSFWGILDKYVLSGKVPVLKIMFLLPAILTFWMFYQDIGSSSTPTSWSIVWWFLIKVVFAWGILLVLSIIYILIFKLFKKRK